MLILLKFLYTTFLLPPGIIIIALVIFSFRLYRKQPRFAVILSSITFVFYLLTTSLVGDSLIRSLERLYHPPEKVSDDAIVVLGAGAFDNGINSEGIGTLPGSSASRLLTGAQLYHVLHVPVILSGGQVFFLSGDEMEIQKHILMRVGVPEDKIIIDKNSLNTTQSGANTKITFEKYGFNKAVLVTSAFHMARSVKQFQKFNVCVAAYPTDYFTNKEQPLSFSSFWPNAGALQNVSLAMKEYIGLLLLRWY